MANKIIVRPADNWRWYFDNQYDCLMLELSNDMVFRSRYPSKMLTPDAFNEFAFSVDDASRYYQFFENCSHLTLNEPQRVELILNAIVASHFLKPQMPKSWYFVQQPMLFIPRFAEVVEAHVQDSGERINLLVVEVGSNASVCLIAEPSIYMAGKQFCLGDVVKVMNDRLSSKNNVLQNQNDWNNDDEDDSVINLLYQICS